MVKKKKIIHNGGDIMNHKRHKGNGNGKSLSDSNQRDEGNKFRNMKEKANKVDDCYKMKLEHSEELNPDDFE